MLYLIQNGLAFPERDGMIRVREPKEVPNGTGNVNIR